MSRLLFPASRRSLCSVVLMALGSSALLAQDDDPVPPAGPVADFLLESAGGERVTLYVPDAPPTATVLAWFSVECPIAKLLAPRLTRFEKRYREQGVRFLGIDPNIQDSAEEIRERADRVGIEFEILRDPLQVVTDRLGVTRTTEVLVLNADYELVYRGAVDDQYSIGGANKPAPRNEWMVETLEALLAGEAVETSRTDAPGCLVGRVLGDADTEAITFSRDVAPVLYRNCTECHRPGQIGPFDMLDYGDVRGWAPMMAEVVAEARMPPWHADPRHGRFANARRLTETERELLVRWADSGAPEGDPADCPPAPRFEDSWGIGTPDLVVELPEPQQVPADGVVPYRYVVVDPEISEDRWVQAIEIRPTNEEVTHHVLVMAMPPGMETRDVFRAQNSGAGGYFAVTVPGQGPNVYPDGTAKFLPAGSKFVFQLHYTPYGFEASDRTRMALRWAGAEPEREMKTRGVYHPDLDIPPYEADVEFTARHRFTEDVEIHTLFPHLHTRGVSFRYEVLDENGTRVLLDVPQYDFNWQNFYCLAEPIRVRKGDVMYCTAVFDNSEDNPVNPDPGQRVRWGEQTFDEMLIGYYDYVEVETDAGTE